MKDTTNKRARMSKTQLPRIKGYCKDCKYSYIEEGKIMNRCKNFGDVIVLETHYCSEWEKKVRK